MADSVGTVSPPAAASALVLDAARVQFDKWALSYDRSLLNELVFFPTIRACQEEILRWHAARGGGDFSVLDVGCGTGRFVNLLAAFPAAKRLVGLDYSPVMVAQLREKIAASPHGAKVEAIEGDSEHLPFPAASFDVLTCCNSFHHYPHQAAVVRGFLRVLKPGGLLILVDGFRDNVIGWLIFDLVVTGIERNVYHVPWAEMRQLLTDAGFPAVRQRKLNVLAPLLVNVAQC